MRPEVSFAPPLRGVAFAPPAPVRRSIESANARMPLAPRQIGRKAITYRGARRNGARELGRKHPRPTMTFRHAGLEATPHWWTGITPNGRMRQPVYRPNISRHRKPYYDAHHHKRNAKGKGFSVWGAMANFFFTPAQRKATALMMGAMAGFRRK